MTSPHERGPAARDRTSPNRPPPSNRAAQGTRLPTQAERIKALLRAEEAVCGTTLLASGMPRYAAVVYRLRSAGWAIATRPCSRPWHSHRTYQIEYYLGGDQPTDPCP